MFCTSLFLKTLRSSMKDMVRFSFLCLQSAASVFVAILAERDEVGTALWSHGAGAPPPT